MDSKELDDLIGELEAIVTDEQPSKGYWSTLWALVRSVGGGFKGTRYPSRAEHDADWQRF